jgi:hypothetical protein
MRGAISRKKVEKYLGFPAYHFRDHKTYNHTVLPVLLELLFIVVIAMCSLQGAGLAQAV